MAKKTHIALALLAIGTATLIPLPSRAATNYFEKLDKDLINNTLTIKSENPKNANGDDALWLSEIILGIIHQKYDLGYNIAGNDQTHHVGVYGVFNGDYSKITFTKSVCSSTIVTDPATGEQSYQSNCDEPETLKTINIKYTGINSSMKAKVSEVASNIYGYNDNDWSNHKRYTVDDLSFINFIAAVNKTDQCEGRCDNAIINYSEEYKQHIANKNISVVVDNRAGDGWPFGFGAVGVGAVLQDGYIYKAFADIGGDVRQILYIPEDTENNHEAYAQAAQKRVNSYLANTKYANKFTFRFGGNIAADFNWSDTEIINNFGYKEDEYYIMSYEGYDYNVVLHKDDKKLKTPSFVSKDTTTDIEITSNDATIPLDTMAEVHEVKTEERKTNIDKLKLKKAKIYDIKLHSNAGEQYINNSSDDFTVNIPIGSDFKGKNLAVYYCDQNGKCETHSVTIKGNNAQFKTGHFSEYILGTTDEDVSNPPTADNIAQYIILLFGSFSTGLFFVANKK